MPVPRFRLLVLACAVAAAPGRSLTAQDANRAMTGRVRDAAGAPLADVSVRLSRDTTTIVARTDNQGRFRFTGLVDGDYMLSALRVGFSPVAEPITVTRDGVHRELVMTARTPVLDSVLVRAQWTGVRGIVFDARNLTPLADARVQLMGTDSVVRSEADGTFAIGLPRGRAVVVRVERDGFLPVLRSADIPDKGYVELDLPLDMATPNPKDLIEQKDLQLRLKMAGAQAVFVTGADLRRSGALSAKEAFYESSSGRRSGVSITRQTCVFVNGQPRPGFPFDALRAADIEFLEAYPGNAENSRTLFHRWPPGAPCGAPGPTERLGDPRFRAQVVSVWTRQLL